MKHQLTPPIHAGPAWQYHFLNLSVADIIVVVLMLIVFALAVLLPFPGHKQRIDPQANGAGGFPSGGQSGDRQSQSGQGPSEPNQAQATRRSNSQSSNGGESS